MSFIFQFLPDPYLTSIESLPIVTVDGFWRRGSIKDGGEERGERRVGEGRGKGREESGREESGREERGERRGERGREGEEGREGRGEGKGGRGEMRDGLYKKNRIEYLSDGLIGIPKSPVRNIRLFSSIFKCTDGQRYIYIYIYQSKQTGRLLFLSHSV